MSSSDISEDLVVEIFKRLPPKSLLRFRSVTKSLCSCIDSREFIRLHMLQSHPQKVVIIHCVGHRRRQDEYFYTLHSPEKLPLGNNGYVGITPEEFPFENYYILGSCNGLILICYIEPCASRHICMWNPSIRRILKIPDNHVLTYRKTHDMIGFGFDPINNDYKIVWINYKHAPGYETNSFVYTMKTGSWSNIASSKTTRFHRVVPRGCFVNGVFHWVVNCLAADGIRYHWSIMTFDFSTHGFGTIDLPNPSEETNYELMIIDSCLAVMSSQGNNIWVRRREHNNNNNIPCWSVHCKLEGYEYAIVFGVATHITTAGNFLVHFAHPYFDQVYNPETRKGSSVVDIRASSYINDMETYVESLELLDTCDQRNQQQPSFVQGKKRSSRTTLRKLIDFFTPCSTPHAN